MKDLIEALTILGKYIDPGDQYPTHCEHDEFYVKGPIPEKMEIAENLRLLALGFTYDEKSDMWKSYRFGSC